MKGIKFQYQAILKSIDELLFSEKEDVKKSFLFNFKNIVNQCLNVTAIMMRELDVDPSLELAYIEMSKKLKKAMKQHK